MKYDIRTPNEGDLHSVVTIDEYTFELRYGYYEERDRSGEPVLVYPDLENEPIYTKHGYRIVTAIQSVCKNYFQPNEKCKEDCCYTCIHFSDSKAEIGICRCEIMKRKTV